MVEHCLERLSMCREQGSGQGIAEPLDDMLSIGEATVGWIICRCSHATTFAHVVSDKRRSLVDMTRLEEDTHHASLRKHQDLPSGFVYLWLYAASLACVPFFVFPPED